LSGLTITGTNFSLTPNCKDETHIKALYKLCASFDSSAKKKSLFPERWPMYLSRLSKSGLYFRSKENSKIGTCKIAIKIEGFYSRTFV